MRTNRHREEVAAVKAELKALKKDGVSATEVGGDAGGPGAVTASDKLPAGKKPRAGRCDYCPMDPAGWVGLRSM